MKDFNELRMRLEPQALQSSSHELLLFAQGSNVIAWLLGRENQQLKGKRSRVNCWDHSLEVGVKTSVFAPWGLSWSFFKSWLMHRSLNNVP